MIYTLIFSLGMLVGTPASIESILLVEGQEESIPSFAEVETTFKFRQSYWVKVNIQVNQNGEYVLSGGKKYLRAMTFYDESGMKLTSGNHVKIGLSTGSQTIYIFYPFLDPKEDHGVAISLVPSAIFFEKETASQMVKTGFLVIVFFFICLESCLLCCSKKERK